MGKAAFPWWSFPIRRHICSAFFTAWWAVAFNHVLQSFLLGPAGWAKRARRKLSTGKFPTEIEDLRERCGERVSFGFGK